MSFKPAIRNWQAQPPAGGWAVEFKIIDGQGEEHKWLFKGQPGAIVEGISEVQKANSIFDGYEPLWDWCNSIWTKRDPRRALPYSTGDGTKVTPQKLGGALVTPSNRNAHRARVSVPCGRC